MSNIRKWARDTEENGAGTEEREVWDRQIYIILSDTPGPASQILNPLKIKFMSFTKFD